MEVSTALWLLTSLMFGIACFLGGRWFEAWMSLADRALSVEHVKQQMLQASLDRERRLNQQLGQIKDAIETAKQEGRL